MSNQTSKTSVPAIAWVQFISRQKMNSSFRMSKERKFPSQKHLSSRKAKMKAGRTLLKRLMDGKTSEDGVIRPRFIVDTYSEIWYNTDN